MIWMMQNEMDLIERLPLMLENGYLLSPLIIFLKNMTAIQFGRCWKKPLPRRVHKTRFL
jgi:hypothetical protein